MSGLIFALLSAACLGGAAVLTKKGTFRAGESSSAVSVTTFLGALIFTVILFVSGEGDKLGALSWQGTALLGGAGVVHFVIGRSLNFYSIHTIGANRSGPLLNTNILFAVMFGVVLLNETLILPLILGILFIAVGVTLVSLSGRDGSTRMRPGGTLIGGILAALVAGLSFGASSLLIKVGLRGIDSPLIGTFVSYIAASSVLGARLILHPKSRYQMKQLNRSSLTPILLAGTVVSIAQLFRYIALDYSPVSIVSPLFATVSLFTLIFSFLVNRSIEAFNLKIITGTLAVIVGAFFVFL
jgi:drug/metabolite transporter (DMT)-like permease